MEITYFGHSAFKLKTADHSVLIDPFISGNPVATVAASDVNAETILLTHAHNDHVGDTVDIARRNGSTVIATFELANLMSSMGVEHAVGGNHGGTIAFAGGSVKFVPAWHTSSFSTDDGVVAPGLPAGLVVRFGGKVIYFAGDTCLFSDMKLIGEVGLDVAVLPIGDHFTMGIEDAVRAASFVNARTVIPCHFNTFAPIKQDGNAFKELVESSTDSTVQVLAPGDTLELPE